MTGKERIAKAFRCEKTDRIPWVPFVGCHAGVLLDVSAEEYLKTEDHIVNGALAAIERYKPDGVPVTFDLQIEAEELGCELNWAKENPPSVSGHALQMGATLDSMEIPKADSGRLGSVLNAARRLRKSNGDIALYGLVTGPFTLALHLLGTDIFMKMFDDPDYMNDLMSFCSRVSTTVAGYYVDAGCDVIAMVDPMTSQIGPDQFRQFVTEHATPVFETIRKAGALSSFFVCGHAQQNIEAMCECKPDNISVDENIPLQYVRDVCLPLNVSFGGNMQLTSVLLLGTPVDAQKNAIECMETGGNKGFILAPGCDLPYSTPPENLEAVAVVVHDEYERQVVRDMAQENVARDILDMREYGQSDKVIVDVITLDSEACAPCQYMVESVKAVTPEFEGIVEWREHKIKYREALVFMTSLMVRNVPTICIDGTITFVSRIPSRDELIAAIQKRINEKLKVKIQSRKAVLYILGDGGEKCMKLKENAEKAATELGADVTVRLLTDEETIASYGFVLSQSPIVVMGRYQTKSVHRVPDSTIIKEWLKDI